MNETYGGMCPQCLKEFDYCICDEDNDEKKLKMSKRTKIEIDFPIEVEITESDRRLISTIVKNICIRECPINKILWLSGQGSKPTFIPMTREEEKERGIEFDDCIEYFEVSIKDEKIQNLRN